MRKVLLLIIIITPFIKAQAQTSVYHPFPDSNAVWNEQDWVGFSNPLVEDYSYQLVGDTIIGGIAYHKIYSPFDQKSGDTIHYSSQHTIGYQGCIRQDTVAKKIYFIQPGHLSEDLLYDFSLQIGGIIPQFSTQYVSLCCNFKVLAIDSILIGSSYRKQWLCGDSSQYFMWSFIEGIGNRAGLLEIACEGGILCLDPIGGAALMCFKQNDSILYAVVNVASCDIITTVQNSDEKYSIGFSPNPFHTLATLTTNKNKSELRIYNTLGTLVREEIITTPSTTINRNSLSNGIYFYQLVSENGQIASGKFVVE